MRNYSTSCGTDRFGICLLLFSCSFVIVCVVEEYMCLFWSILDTCVWHQGRVIECRLHMYISHPRP